MRRVCCALAGALLLTAAAAAEACARPQAGPGWAAAEATLDRVRRCKGYWFFCISRLSRAEYAPFAGAASRREQKRLFLAQVNAPPRADTRNVVLGVADAGAGASAITGQRARFAGRFSKHAGSAAVPLSAASLVNEVLRTGLFGREDTFVGLVFDARFGYADAAARKDAVETAYFEYLVGKLGPRVGTIYLAGHGRGGCLAMRLSARLARAFPSARVIVHNFDGVCAAAGTGGAAAAAGEFGVTAASIPNPLRKGYEVAVSDVAAQFPARGCVAVRAFLSGECVTATLAGVAAPVHAFGAAGAAAARDDLVAPGGFAWYAQSFHAQGHVAIAGRHHAAAVKHLRQALAELPCACGA